MPLKSILLCSVFAASLLVPAYCATPRYTAVDLGTFGGNQTIATAINDSSQVVGSSRTTSNSQAADAFRWTSGVLTDLGTGAGAAINGSGQVVFNTTPLGHGFLYNNGVVTDLGTLGGPFSQASGINDAGSIVGWSYLPDRGPYHAFRYSGGAMTDLGTLGGTHSQANGINGSEQIVGSSEVTANMPSHAFLYSSGVMSDMGTLGGTGSSAQAINDAGQIVGASTIAGNAVEHAFLYSNGMMHDLGTLGGSDSAAAAINNSGQVVGTSFVSTDFLTRAFLYSGGVMYDLNTLVVPHFGFPNDVLVYASGINSSGQIVASSGLGHAYLLSPILPLTITGPPSLPSGTVGAAYGPVQLTATGGAGPYHWSVGPSQLPGGITLDSATGMLHGTPAMNTQGDFNGIQFSLTDSMGTIAGVTLTLHIDAAPPPMITSVSPNPILGVNASQGFFVNGSGFTDEPSRRLVLTWPGGQVSLLGNFFNSTQLSASFNFSIAFGTWTAQEFNGDGQPSNIVFFTVVNPASGATTRMALPQIQFGGAWYSALYFSNTTNAAATVQVNFMDDANAPLPVPLVGIGSVASRTVQLNPGATAVLKALSGGNSGGEGWVSASLPAGVIAYEVLRQVIAGRADQEALVPFTSASSQTADFSYDDTALVTAAAFLNPSSQQVVVTATAYGPDGSQVASTQVPLAPGQKSTDILKHYPGMSGISGKQGRVVVSVPNGAVSVLVLRFGGEAFTDVPVNYR